MELLPGQQVLFDVIIQKLRDSFSLYGFTPLDTPIMESSDILLAKSGGETEKQIYTLQRGENELALRFDLTVPLAKYVALNYGQLSFPFRRYQIGKVYRGERAQRGRFREFYQADIDIIGDGALDIISEAEIPGIIYNAFTSLGLNRFIIKINNRKMLSGLFEILGTADAADEVMRNIDKLPKIGSDKLLEILTGDVGTSETAAKELLEIASHQGNPFDVLQKYRGKNETFDKGVFELEAVVHHMSDFGVPETHFKVDLSIARGLDYYTGTVYETFMTDHPEVGSICSGGRYDDLAGYYTDKKLPGVGISIGVTRLFFILQEQGMLSDSVLTSPVDVLIIPMTQDRSPAISLATTMRDAGLRLQIAGDDKKLKAWVTYANKLGIPFVVFLGEDELNRGLITVKDMTTGNQTTASAGILTAGIIDKIQPLRRGNPIGE